MTIKEAALDYINKGMSVIPIRGKVYTYGKTDKEKYDNAKKPLIEWKEYQSRLPTIQEIDEWFEEWPQANIGIVTGKISNLTVIDCDSTEAIEAFRKYYKGITPCAKTSKGVHYYFQYAEGTRNAVKINNIPLDLRSEGGYVVAPPSINGNGSAYTFIKDFSISKDSFIFFTQGVDTGLSTTVYNGQQVSTNMFSEGQRDEDLFHTANCLIKGGMKVEFAYQVLKILAENCNPPFPEKELDAKLKSALSRSNARDKTLKDLVYEEIMSTTGNFLSTDIEKRLQLSTRNDKKNLSIIMKRFLEQGLIEKYGNKNGSWRLINKDFTEQKWWEDEGKPLPIQYPLGVEKYAKVYAGNIILLEGQKSQGKSQFALEFCRLNKNLFPKERIRYQNVEMADSEITGRFHKYPSEIITPDRWRKLVEIIRVTENWWDLVLPDGLNVIDYLIEYSETFRLPEYVFNIHKKLKTGIALVIVQRDPFKPYPVGGRGTRDIPRLILSLIHHKIKLEDVKSFANGIKENPTGLYRTYKMVDWWKFLPQDEWHREEEEKYKSFAKSKNDDEGGWLS